MLSFDVITLSATKINKKANFWKGKKQENLIKTISTCASYNFIFFTTFLVVERLHSELTKRYKNN